MNHYPRYDGYKDTKIKWINEIPDGWTTEKAKWLFQKMERPTRPDDEIVTVFRDGEVTLRRNRRLDGFTNAIQEHGYQGIRKGDLVIHGMDAFAGAIGVSDSNGKSTPVYSACTPRKGNFKINNYYYAYLLRYMADSGFILSLAKGIRERSTDFRFNDFAKLTLPVPSFDEQQKIANFLDQKTAEIDEAIAKKQKLIELLQEQKAILINQAVTKGLNPNVTMCDSGIDWIGEIPEHWKVLPLTKYILSLVDYRGKTPQKVESGIFLVTAKNIKNGIVDYQLSKEYVSEQKYGQIMSRGKPKIDDILFTTEAPLGEVALVDREEIALAQRIIKFRLDTQYLLPNYTKYSLISHYFQKHLQSEATGSTAQGIKASKLHKLRVIVPPLEEQKTIDKYLEKTISKIDILTTKQSDVITILQEYKQILVSNAVTGKIKI